MAKKKKTELELEDYADMGFDALLALTDEEMEVYEVFGDAVDDGAYPWEEFEQPLEVLNRKYADILGDYVITEPVRRALDGMLKMEIEWESLLSLMPPADE